MTAEVANAALIGKIVRRLEERAERFELAKEIYRGIRQSSPAPEPLPFAGERDVPGGGLCSNPGGSGRFDCAKDDFSCATFSCDASFLYSDCSGAKTEFSCKDGGFSCGNGKGGTDTFYDCTEFSCGGKDQKYTCNADYDFYCEDEFECIGQGSTFECSAGHIFRCNDDHDCTYDFKSTAGGSACVPAFPYRSDEGDTVPGDCGCGTHGGDADEFICTRKFDCNSADEFECEYKTVFKCAQAADGLFKCSAKIKGFQCETKGKFTCATAAKFTCSTTYDATTLAFVPVMSPLGLSVLTGVLGAGGALALWLRRRREQSQPAETTDE